MSCWRPWADWGNRLFHVKQWFFPGLPAPDPRVLFRPCGAGRSFAGLPGRPRPGFGAGPPSPDPGLLFARAKSNQKAASLRLERLIMFCLRAQRHRLVWSPDSASCGTDGQKRLPLRRALWAYRSLGLEALRLIHMKCGATPTLLLLFHRSSSYGKTDGSTPLTGRQPK